MELIIEDAQKAYSEDPRIKNVDFINLYAKNNKYRILGYQNRVLYIFLGVYNQIFNRICELHGKKQIIETLVTYNKKGGVKVIISDQGPCWDDKKIQKAFQQTSETLKEHSYLSLHTCANFMTEMNGRLSFESNAQKSSFIIEWEDLSCERKI